MGKKPILNQILSAQNDITINYINQTLQNPNAIISDDGRSKGIKFFEEMLYEDRVASEMQKRKLAVVGKEWEILPATEDAQDIKIAEYVKEVFLNFPHDQARQTLLSGIVTGFKVAEIMWDYSEGDIWIKELIGASPRRFVFDLDGNLRLITWKNMIYGEELPDRKFVVFRNPSDNGSPYGDALGRALYWPIWFKKNGVKFWAVFLDKFGQPTPWGKYPLGTAEEDQIRLLESLKAIQTDQAIITPDTMTVELLEAARASSFDSYDRWEQFWNNAITFLILGQTATTEGTPGKLGGEEARAQVRYDILKADADLLCECENTQLIKWLVDYNFPGVKKYPKIWIRTEPEKDLKGLAERDKILIKEIGLPTPISYLRNTYGIPEPQEGEAVIIPPTSRFPLGFKDNKQFLSFAEQEDWIAEYLTRLAPVLKSIRKDVMKDVEQYLLSRKEIPTEEEFLTRLQNILGEAYKKIDKDEITSIVSEIYQKYRWAPGAKIVFGAPDIRSINFLASLDRFYLSKFVTNPDAKAALTDFLKTQYLEKGESIFWRRDKAIIEDLKNLLAQKMTELEDYQINRIVDTGVQRIRNWADIQQMHEAGIAEIEIYEPTEECPFCASMNGKIIEVDLAYQKMMELADMEPEEYEKFLKANPPSLEGIEDFVAKGMLPPYHPHCRGTIIKRRK